MPCSWGVKAGMVRVWVAGKTVWSPCYTRAISERFRDKGLIIKRYINSSVYFTLLTDPKPAMDSLSIWLPRHKRPGSSCPHSACWEWDYLYAIKNKQLIWLQCSYKNRLTVCAKNSMTCNTRPSVIILLSITDLIHWPLVCNIIIVCHGHQNTFNTCDLETLRVSLICLLIHCN